MLKRESAKLWTKWSFALLLGFRVSVMETSRCAHPLSVSTTFMEFSCSSNTCRLTKTHHPFLPFTTTWRYKMLFVLFDLSLSKKETCHCLLQRQHISAPPMFPWHQPTDHLELFSQCPSFWSTIHCIESGSHHQTFLFWCWTVQLWDSRSSEGQSPQKNHCSVPC